MLYVLSSVTKHKSSWKSNIPSARLSLVTSLERHNKQLTSLHVKYYNNLTIITVQQGEEL